MDRGTLLKYFPDPTPSNLAVYVAPGAELGMVRHEIEKASAGRNVLIFSNRDLRMEAIRIFDQTFAITYALEAVAIFVAVMGIAGALVALVMDRRRELGLLRFLGAATGQIRKMILVEAGLLGLLANVCRVGPGNLVVVGADLRNQQAVVWLDDPVSLAGGRAGGRAYNGVCGDSGGGIVSGTYRDEAQSN